MAELVQFELVSPEKLLVSDEVHMVVVPGTEGNFGVLPGHAPMLSTVRPGVIDVYGEHDISKRIFVAGGFADVTETGCTVLAEEAVDMAELTVEGVKARLQAGEDTLAEADNIRDRTYAEREIMVSTAMLEALSHG